MSRLSSFLLAALVPLACTTVDPVDTSPGAASFPLTIYAGEEGIWAPDKDLPGKSAQAPGRYTAQGPFKVDMSAVQSSARDDKAPSGMKKVKDKRIESPVSEEERERMLEDSKRLPPNARAAKGLLRSSLTDPAAQLGPTIGTGIDGIDYINSVPPDPELAVGPNHMIATVNSAFIIFDKSGNVEQAQTDFDSFFAPANCSNTFDPNALYDEDQDRFIIAMDGNGDQYCVAVSQTGDPTQGWNLYTFDTGSDFFDYPHAGVGRDAIYMGANIFKASYDRAEIYALDKFAMYAGQSAQYVVQNIGGAYFTPLPVNLHGANQGTWPDAGPHYIISGVYNGDDFHVWSWSDPFGANILTRVNSFSMDVATGTNAANTLDQPQLGSAALIQGNDWRPMDAEYRDGYVWMTHAIACNPGSGPVNCIRWAQIDPLSVTVLDAGVLATNGEYRSFPNLAVDACGNMAVGYTKTSSGMYPSVYVAGREAADPAGTLQAENLAKAGETSYTAFDGSPHRWGDYTSMTIDPDGTTFWYLGEYSKNTGSNNGRWGTWINASSFGCVPPNAPAKVSVDTASVSTLITAGDNDIYVDNCELVTLDFSVRNSGAGVLSNLEIVSVTPVSHPNTVISGSFPRLLAASLSETDSVAASFEFQSVDAAYGETLTFDVEIYADELTENKIVTLSVDQAETDSQAFASKTWNFDSDLEDWSVVQGTFTSVGGYVASSANQNNQCDQIRSPQVTLQANSTLSLETNYDIEARSSQWWDQANVAIVSGSQRDIRNPDSGRVYNANGAGAVCVTAGGDGWASSSTSWANSGWSSSALGAAAVAGGPVNIDIAYGTDGSVAGRGFWFDTVTLTNFTGTGPDAQSNSCGNGSPPVSIDSFTADPTNMLEGDSTVLTWSVSDATSCSASGDWGGAKANDSGSEIITENLAGDFTYTLNCTGDGAPDSASVTVSVTAPPTVSIDSFTASPANITEGESSALSWSTSNAESCSASGDWGGPQETSGSNVSTGALATAGTYTFTLTCVGAAQGDQATADATVTVAQQPSTLHVADLDGSSTPSSRGRWNAEIRVLVHDDGEAAANGVTVSGSWTSGTNGSGSCVTSGNGTCVITKNNLKSNVSAVSLRIDSLSNGVDSYDSGANHDPDGDSDGTSITAYQDGPPANESPNVGISAPSDGATFTADDSVTFTASASDAEDGDLSVGISWSSSLDGPLGNGASISASALSIGAHTITATVNDSAGASGSDNVNITVIDGSNTPPTVSISEPGNGTNVTAGDSVTFTASASDSEDGNLSATIGWTSSIDGNLGSGASFSTSTLSVGTHTITAAVSDSGGLSDSDTVNITVEQPAGSITVTGDGSKSRGNVTVILTWAGAISSSVDIYRDGLFVTTTANPGSYTDSTKGGSPIVYQVCEQGTSTCGSTSVTF